MKEALYYEKTSTYVVCELCPHKCEIAQGKSGLCRTRINIDGKLIAAGYGSVSALGLDPIEKKPLRHFYPGSWILSLGGFGCNMQCAFCQNHAISQNRVFINSCEPASKDFFASEEVLRKAYSQHKNIGIAFTYNEPLINIEYIMDIAPLFRAYGLKIVLVTNGLICPEPLADLLPLIDALNIDVKGFNEAFYKKLGGDLSTVKNTVETAATRCHVEITNLIVPGENDIPEEMEALADWLATISPEIPLHINRFFPHYRMTNKPPTLLDTLNKLAAIAQSKLRHVHIGNI
ncbi:MAG: AmmeMemoRadiSam system radical SAM enzyme [Clostridiales bacterium]|nr:AmmeMemoRadiSam system radical SAM enzyme [Clostridiales bacterium]